MGFFLKSWLSMFRRALFFFLGFFFFFFFPCCRQELTRKYFIVSIGNHGFFPHSLLPTCIAVLHAGLINLLKGFGGIVCGKCSGTVSVEPGHAALLSSPARYFVSKSKSSECV